MGLLKTAGRAYVASTVHGRVQRRQQSRWAQQDQLAQAARFDAPPPPAPAAPATVTAPPPGDMARQLELLKQLGELRDAGILTADEFAAKKAEILGD